MELLHQLHKIKFACYSVHESCWRTVKSQVQKIPFFNQLLFPWLVPKLAQRSPHRSCEQVLQGYWTSWRKDQRRIDLDVHECLDWRLRAVWEIYEIVTKKSIHNSQELFRPYKIIQDIARHQKRWHREHQEKIIFWSRKIICNQLNCRQAPGRDDSLKAPTCPAIHQNIIVFKTISYRYPRSFQSVGCRPGTSLTSQWWATRSQIDCWWCPGWTEQSYSSFKGSCGCPKKTEQKWYYWN